MQNETIYMPGFRVSARTPRLMSSASGATEGSSLWKSRPEHGRRPSEVALPPATIIPKNASRGEKSVSAGRTPSGNLLRNWGTYEVRRALFMECVVLYGVGVL